MRDNLVSRAVTASDTFRKYFTDTYDQFYTQAESTVTTFSEQDKLEQQFLDANGRILLSTSGSVRRRSGVHRGRHAGARHAEDLGVHRTRSAL